jgi:hypothetical protein
MSIGNEYDNVDGLYDTSNQGRSSVLEWGSRCYPQKIIWIIWYILWLVILIIYIFNYYLFVKNKVKRYSLVL